ncbi:C1 family peptidase [Halosquirtibacter xylanolyticus]|uniref:C1 family peptidase n=1 Tax=Halosquirtibacter xylanolyticus TaxID=3374599 RepID=UPI0037484000|nr:C1 family peptidase [Prolixibacteraceae bacterium]
MKHFQQTGIVLLFILSMVSSITLNAQTKKDQYQVIYEVPNTSVKNQQQTGTCWCFSTISFLESELIKSKKQQYDLSEMFAVKEAYHQKIENYVLRQGKANFSQGGQAHDVIYAMKSTGIVPQKIYKGNNYGKIHNHTALVKELKKELEKDNSEEVLPNNWLPNADQILDIYFGQSPSNFDYDGENYTPKSFLKSLNLNLDDYIEITSYTHHPFNQTFVLEIPDNWSNGSYYNVPIDRYMAIIDYALEKGYSIVWDGDVSEKTFQHKNGIAYLPEGTDVSQEARQKTFYNKETTDDHLMHLVGKATKDGKNYYIIKNSWDSDSNEYGGYLYMSEDFVRLKTVCIMLNKKSLTKKERKQLKI